MRKQAVTFLAIALLALTPSISMAAGLSVPQINAILGLLNAFNVEASVVASVAGILTGASAPQDPAPVDPPPASTGTTTPAVRPSTEGSPYIPGNLGYDISFNTHNYPQIPFGFAVIGVTSGKAYTHNARLASEFDWARLGSITRPTLYLNINAPYGSSANAANLSSPQKCGALWNGTTTSSSAGGTFAEPTACAAYNYGYNLAKDAYAYATQQSVSSKLWWLDVEEANSWSPDTLVNDQVIQGAIDYLNTRDVRAGIYSVPYMWKNIAGAFSPKQQVGSETTTPTWFPIGISTQVGALNACLDHASFIPGSPVWIIQYELDHTAVDQNIAC